MPVNAKKAMQAIQELEHAGHQAKGFLRFMTALGNCTDALKELGQIEAQATAAEQRKDEYERQIPALENRVQQLQQQKGSLDSEIGQRLQAAERTQRDRVAALTETLECDHQARKSELQREIEQLENSKAALEEDIKELQKQNIAADRRLKSIQSNLQKASEFIGHSDA